MSTLGGKFVLVKSLLTKRKKLGLIRNDFKSGDYSLNLKVMFPVYV